MALHLNQLRLTAALSTLALAGVALNSACDGSSSGNNGSGGSTSHGGTPSTAGSNTSTAGNQATSGTGPNTGGNGTSGSGGATGGAAGADTGGGSPGGAGGDGGASGGGSGGGVSGTRVPGTEGYNCTPPSGSAPTLKATAVVSSGLSEPISLTHAPNDTTKRLFVIERSGTVRIIKDGALVTKPFLDVKSKVVAGTVNGDERGLLGMAFHPNYATNGLLYLHYNDKADPNDTGDSIIEEYKAASATADEADVASGRIVLRVEQPDNSSATFRNHKGGAINFGSDGFLYIGLGDGGGSGDTDASHGPTGNGQNLASLLGKMLRIDPVKSASAAYTNPPGNLKDKMSAAAPEIWDYGLRNPFRSSFDGCTGDLYIGDVGQNLWEEVNIEKAGDGNKNYGWNTMEASRCYKPNTGCVETGITKPLAEYDHDAGKSITGGAVYRGSAIPALRGSYLYADYQSNTIWSLVYDRDKGTASKPVSLKQDINNVTSIVAIRNGADGELYFVSLMGGIYRLDAAQ